jgi:maltose alpha-D-glucosyltransferase/alpha-amylase
MSIDKETRRGGDDVAAGSSATSWAEDPLWYRDAIIYQVHVKSFFDSNDDGVGDFNGLRQKLDYIQKLGINAIWLLPFYPSPMRDDGYDIANYRGINPAYGNRRDFRGLIREAHERGLKVITELDVNHPSDQHAWFRAARAAPKGSSKRDFYVWCDTDKKFPETRIIFTDTEESNWAWDPVAEQYYWHRFFSHQPDLNHNNPKVVEAVIRVMRFWLDMGVDGLRLDAIPYLCVREGTDNENLPETHAAIKRIRAAVDKNYENRMLLAEANQWPEDVRDYFGDADECHMAYHFPVMPRMYMAIAQEDRHPIVEIMQQTPEIPDSCQWAIFLRNHDELTLEMVTDKERDYMYQTYASDPRMRINVGIRRRLAPLMDNDLDRIRLMNSLLLSMPGSPIIYYGDELGMGDNTYLGDRNAVRTPMQWSPDRNGGFSKADPQSLYLPPVMDAVYGYQAVNVEAQSRDPSSLLNWMRRILGVRRSRRAFGRGTLKFLKPGNRKILAYLREFEDETVLCVANLSRYPQPVELDLSRFEGRVPIEMVGETHFPPIGRLPYLLTLPAHGYYWFDLEESAEVPAWHEDQPAYQEPQWLVLHAGLESFDTERAEADGRGAVARRLHEQFRDEVLPEFLAHRRWFAAKGETIDHTKFVMRELWNGRFGEWLLTLVDAEFDGGSQRYFLPLGICWENEEERLRAIAASSVARVRQRAKTGRLFDAFADPGFCRDVLRAMKKGEPVSLGEARLEFPSTHVLPGLLDGDIFDLAVRRTRTAGSNYTLMVGDRLFLKGYRRIREGVNPEWEMGRFLTEISPCEHIVPVAGAVQLHRPNRDPIVLAMVQSFVQNQGDGWQYTLDYLDRFVDVSLTGTDDASPGDVHRNYSRLMGILGNRTAALHCALAVEGTDPAFDVEPIDAAWLGQWLENIGHEATRTLSRLAERRDAIDEECQALVDWIDARGDWGAMLASLRPPRIEGIRTRYHGDYHLAQVLLAEDDFIITDLEGEPGRSLEERRGKHTALKDLSGLLRSLDYARATTLRAYRDDESPGSEADLSAALDEWYAAASTAFLDGYRSAIGDCGVWPEPAGAAEALLKLAGIEKALYEIRYELDNRPEWLAVPLRGLKSLLS